MSSFKGSFSIESEDGKFIGLLGGETYFAALVSGQEKWGISPVPDTPGPQVFLQHEATDKYLGYEFRMPGQPLIGTDHSIPWSILPFSPNYFRVGTPDEALEIGVTKVEGSEAPSEFPIVYALCLVPKGNGVSFKLHGVLGVPGIPSSE